jgi:putative hydrolase
LTEDAKRIDLHVHSIFSDGVLLPSELLRRVVVKGYRAVAITDHADASNLEDLIASLVRFARQQEGDFPLTFIPGVELTHVAPWSIAPLAQRAKELGAGLVLVHGETISEPVRAGTNRAAVECSAVDLLAHPGFITPEEAHLAAENDVYLEITSREGHCLTNGYVANMARQAGAKLVVNTDAHTPRDMIDQEMARRVAAGAGLNEAEVEAATVTNPQTLVQKAVGKGSNLLNSQRKEDHPDGFNTPNLIRHLPLLPG